MQMSHQPIIRFRTEANKRRKKEKENQWKDDHSESMPTEVNS